MYIYLFEQKVRHSFELIKENTGPFENKLLIFTQKISDVFKNSVYISNSIFAIGSLFGITLIGIDVYNRFPYGAALTGVGLFSLLVSFFISGSISGETWITRIYKWVITFSNNMIINVLKGLLLELFFIINGLIFISFVIITLGTIVENSPTPANLRILVYALPIFAVLWVYRLNDYKERYNFQLNIRRFIMFSIVAAAYLFLKDPNSLMIIQVEEIKLETVFIDIMVVVFITLDRLGKVIIEILREADIKANRHVI